MQQLNHGTSAGTPNLIAGASTFFQTCQKPEILENFYCQTFVPNVSNGRRLQGILDSNKLSYTFSRVERPTVHSLTLGNAEYPTPEIPGITECTIRLGGGGMTSIKLNHSNLSGMVDKGDAYKSDLSKNSGEVLNEKHQSDFMCWLSTQVHPCNQGKKAGVQSGSLDLGSPTDPFLINPINSLALGTMLNQSLDEHRLPKNRAMIIPSVVAMQMRLSIGVSQANIGRGVSEMMNAQCADLNGMAPCGQEIYEYSCMQGKVVNGKMVFPVYYVWKDALDTASGVDEVNSGIFASDQSRGELYYNMRTIMRWGFASVYCQGIARAWVSVDENWMKKLPGNGCTV
jgi:hypothetical protein